MKITVPENMWAMLKKVPKEDRPKDLSDETVMAALREKLTVASATDLIPVGGIIDLVHERTGMRDFFYAVTVQVLRLLQEAAKAQDPVIYLATDPEPTGHVGVGKQYLWFFSVTDQAKPWAVQENWHGQNTSQWVYAGAICLQDGKISVHT